MSQDTEDFNGETIALIRGYRPVRQAATDWQTFSSHVPGRVPIPAEDDVRDFRQFPVEVDPPDHTDFRALVQPWFRRAHSDAAYIANVRALVEQAVDDLLRADTVEAVSEFALPLQSRALTILLGLPMSEADAWISWGVHAFRVEGKNDPTKAAVLDAYIAAQMDRARDTDGPDLFAFLARCSFRGRHLSDAEIKGMTHLTFAGGRDTVIHLLTAILAHLAVMPRDLDRLRETPSLILSAVEELIRATSPLPLIGRTCTRAVPHSSGEIAKGNRVGLCWAAANHDETIFDCPADLRIDRKPNPHVGFGSGLHTCVGAPHARLLARVLLETLALKIAKIEVRTAVDAPQSEATGHQAYFYDKLVVAVQPR